MADNERGSGRRSTPVADVLQLAVLLAFVLALLVIVGVASGWIATPIIWPA